MMIFDPSAFGEAFGLVLLSFIIGLVISSVLEVLRMGQKM